MAMHVWCDKGSPKGAPLNPPDRDLTFMDFPRSSSGVPTVWLSLPSLLLRGMEPELDRGLGLFCSCAGKGCEALPAAITKLQQGVADTWDRGFVI